MENLNYAHEEWRDIKGYKINGEFFDYTGLYQVSNFGIVKSLDRTVPYSIKTCHTKERKGKIIRHDVSYKHYHRVMLSKNGLKDRFLVHRLVAFAFPEICGEWFENAICNHKDENPDNNFATNIEWCNYSYNNTYNNKGSKISKKNSKTVLQYSLSGVLIKEWESANSTIQGGYSPAHVSSCCRFERKTHKGYIWKYK